jgi:hypothetical protein
MAAPLGGLPLFSAVHLGNSRFAPVSPSRAIQGPLSVGEFPRGGDYPLHRSHDPKMFLMDHASVIENGIR